VRTTQAAARITSAARLKADDPAPLLSHDLLLEVLELA
jgi:hypothetical protein